MAHHAVTRSARRRHFWAPWLLSGGLAALAAGCTPQPTKENIRISGSSTVFPVIEKAIARYTDTKGGRNVKILLSAVGTSAGLREFCQGTIPITNASRPISTAELQTCTQNGITFIELPLAFDAITVVANPATDWTSSITTRELERTWSRQAEGRVKQWSQINIDWPAKPLKLCGPGSESGTFDYFNEAINGNSTNARRDYEASEDDTVIAKCVASQPGSMGYFGFAYFKANSDKLKALAVASKDGIPVHPSIESVQSGAYKPLSRPLFIYVNDKQLRENDAIRSFVSYTVRNGLGFVNEAGYIPLPADVYRIVESKLYKHILGTSFGGDLPVGLDIDEALSRSFDETRRREFR